MPTEAVLPVVRQTGRLLAAADHFGDSEQLMQKRWTSQAPKQPPNASAPGAKRRRPPAPVAPSALEPSTAAVTVLGMSEDKAKQEEHAIQESAREGKGIVNIPSKPLVVVDAAAQGPGAPRPAPKDEKK